MKNILYKLNVVLLLAVCAVGKIWGNDDELIIASSFNTVTDWAKNDCSEIEVSPTEHRTGSSSMRSIYTSSGSEKSVITASTCTIPTPMYMHIIGYAKMRSDCSQSLPNANVYVQANCYLERNGKGDTVQLNKTTWRKFKASANYTSTKNASYARIHRKANVKTDSVFIDDVIVYKSDKSVLDETAPNAPGSPSATASTISWTRSKDGGGTSDSTGVQGTYIFKRISGSSDDLNVNQNGVYVVGDKDNTGHWEVVEHVTSPTTTSSTASLVEDTRYALVHRDMVYNMSSAVYVSTPASSACTSITPSFSTDYTSTTLTLGGGNSSTPAINKDGSSGAVSFSVTSASPSGSVTVNSSTGVVTPVKVGTATITATVAANGDYCSGTVTKDFTVKGTITYNANGDGAGNATGTTGSVPTDANLYASGASITVAGKSTLAKTNCAFAGWNTAANGSGTWYDPGASISMGESNITLYAQWAPCISTADFDGRYGAGKTDAEKTSSDLWSTFNILNVISSSGDTRYDEDEGFEGLKLKNAGDWIGFGVASGSAVEIATKTVNASSSEVTIDFSSATDLSENADNEYASASGNRFFRIKSTAKKAVVLNQITITPSCTAPSSVTVSSPLGSTGWAYIKGETIQMQANVTGGSGTPHYTWQKKIDSEFEDIDGAPDDDDYEIANCTASNSGTYRCIVSTGDGCSTTSSEFDVKVYRVQILLSAATTDYDFTTIDRTEGYVQCDILLQENTDYAFKILEGHVGLGNNSATGLSVDNCTNWGMWSDNANHVGLKTNYTDNYRFTWKFASASNNNTVSVTYPTHNQTADKTIYFDNSKTNWSNIYYRIGNAGHNENSGMVSKNDVTKVAGTANFYQLTTWAYNNFLAWHFADNTSWSGDKNSIYKTDGAGYVINNHTAWQKYVVSSTITLSPTTNDGGTPKVWSVDKTTGMKTYTVTSSPTNCTITLEKCTNYGSGTYTALSSGGTVMPTQYVKVTVTPSTGHEWNSFSVSGTEGTDYDVVTAAAAGTPGVYIIMGDVTFTASCSVSTYDINYHDGKGMSFSGSHADGHPTTHTYGTATNLKTATKSGYVFGGWYDDEDFSGDPITSLAADGYTDDIDLYAKWEKDVYLNLNDKWETDGMYFAVYCWNNSSSENTWVWMELAEVCSSPAVYKATIPSNYYDRIIFVHKNSNTLVSWDNKDHQSADLEFPGSKDQYTLSKEDGTGDWAASDYSAPTWTISFAGNDNTGGSMSNISSIACDANQAITANAFTKTGYNFAGWKANVDVKISDATVTAGSIIANNATIQNIRGNITLTAQWTAQEYNITYRDQGDATFSGSHYRDKPAKHTYGSETTLKPAFKDGYVFGGWYTASDCSTGLVTTIGATDKTADFKLYAKWTAMSLDALEGGTMYYAQDMVPAGVAVGASSQYYPGVSENNMFNMRGTGTQKSATCPMYAQDKDQKDVGGIDFTQAIFFRYTAGVSGTTVPTHNAIQFEISHAGYLDIYCNAPKTIYMIKSGGSAAQLDASATGGAKITKEVTAGTYYLYSTSGTYDSGSDAPSTSERIFAMKFRPIYSVTYNANGGSGTTTDASSPYNDGSEVTTLSNSFTYSGYKFKWWNTAANGSGEDFYVGEKFNIAADANLYAQWESVASDEAFWVGDNFTFSDNVMSVGDMRVKKYNVDLNQDITQDYNQVNKQNGHAKKAKVMAMDANDEYIEIYFSDGSPIKKLYLGATSDQTTDQNIVVVYSATSDFTTAGGAAHEFKQVGENTNLVTIPGHDQTTKSVTDVSPSKDNLYTHARIYRRIGDANSVFDNTSNLGTGNKLRIYSIKAKKGTYSYSITYDCDGADSGCPSNVAEQTALPNPLPAAPLKSGYMFDGWYTNSGKTDAAVAGATLTANATLYAKWVELEDICETLNTTWLDAYADAKGEGTYGTINGVKYDIETLSDDEDGITMGWLTNHDTYFQLNIGDLGVIKEVKITIADESHDEGGNYGLVADFFEDDTDFTYYSLNDNWEDGDNWIETTSVSTGDLSLRPVSGDNNSIAFQTNNATLTISSICVYYEPTYFTVTYAANGGSGDVPTEADKIAGATVTVLGNVGTPSTLSKTNYTFGGWSYGGDDYDAGDTFEMPAENVTLTAIWTPETHDVTFNLTDADYSSGTNEGTNVAAYGTDYTVTFAASSGYTLPDAITVTIGGDEATEDTDYTWDKSTGTVTVKGASILDDIVIEIEAEAAVTTYSVTYAGDGNTGGSVPTDATAYNGGETVTVATPANTFVKTDYTFRGWKYNGTFYLPGQSFTMPAANVTVTAVWEPNSLGTKTLFSTDFSDAEWSGITNICNSTSADDEEHNGITFHSYDTKNVKPFTVDNSAGTLTWCNNNMGNKYWIAIPVTGVNGSITITVDNGSSATRFNYAYKQETSISGDPGNGTSSTSADPSTVTISNLDESDYVVYLGRQGSGNTTVTSITITTPGADGHFDVAFDNQTGFGGTSSLPSTIYGVENGLKILQPSTPTATGYTFGGWYTDDGCASSWTWGSSTVTSDMTLYAKWTANETTVTINANTGNHGSTAPSAFTATYGQELPEFTAATGESGWNLTGYYDAATDGTKVIDADGTFSSNDGVWNRTDGETLTLYAQYEEALYTITYNANGGSCATSTATQTSASDELTLPTPTWSGYSFDGWYNAGSKIGGAGDKYEPTDDINLYAKWTDNIDGKVFSFIDHNYGDKFEAFDESGWVSSNQNKKGTTYTNATTGVQFIIDDGTWENKTNAIAALAKFNGSGSNVSSMSIVIPAGYIATVKILYGAYGKGDDYCLTVGGTKQANPDGKLDNGSTNAQVIAAMKEITLENQTGTLTLGIYNTEKNHYIGRVAATITGYQDLTYVGGSGSNWNTTANWSPECVPTIEHDVVIESPVVVNIEHATAKSIVIYNNGSDKTGKLTIQPNKGLEVDGTIQKTTDGSTKTATGEADLVLESSSAGNASLIFNNSNSCQATVQMYSKAGIDGSTWNWQYVGTPFTGSIPLYNYYGSWMYKWDNGGWAVVKGGDELDPFAGYCLTQSSATTHYMGGTLIATDGNDQEITMNASKDMVLANSWTAPIYIGGFTEITFTSEPATIYLFNTGSAEEGSSEGTEANTFIAVPVNAGPYVGTEFIAPMQGFFVTTNSGSAGTITMKYDELVRPADSRGIVAGSMKAPKRIEERPEVMKIRAEGSVYNDRVVILSREDFSQGFDNGWDGKKMSFGNASPSVYVINEEGGYDAVSAIPEYEGTVVGFRAGTDSEYTIRFEYDGEEMLYLNDLQEQEATPIDSMRTYTFTAEAGDNEARFIISTTPIQKVITDIDPASGEQSAKVRKVIINDHIYIIRGGRMYSVDGALVK